MKKRQKERAKLGGTFLFLGLGVILVLALAKPGMPMGGDEKQLIEAVAKNDVSTARHL